MSYEKTGITDYDYSPENVARMKLMWEKGMSVGLIANREGCNYSTLRHYFGLVKRAPQTLEHCLDCNILIKEHVRCKKCKILLHDEGFEKCRCGLQHGINNNGFCEKHI